MKCRVRRGEIAISADAPVIGPGSILFTVEDAQVMVLVCNLQAGHEWFSEASALEAGTALRLSVDKTQDRRQIVFRIQEKEAV